jgi:MFS family permease
MIYTGNLNHAMWLAFIGLAFFSAGSTTYPLSQAAMIDIAGTNKLRYLSWQAIPMILLTVAAQWSVYLIAKWSWQLPLGLAIFLGSTCVILATRYLPETRPKKVLPMVPIDLEIFMAISPYFKSSTLRILLVYMIFLFAWGLFSQEINIYLSQTLRYSLITSNIFNLVLDLGMVFTALILPWVIRQQKQYANGINFAIVQSLFGALALLFTRGDAVWVCALVFVSGVAIGLLLMWTSISDAMPTQFQGLTMCVLGPLWAIAWGFSGVLAQTLDIYHAKLPMLFAAVLLGVAFLLCYRKPQAFAIGLTES